MRNRLMIAAIAALGLACLAGAGLWRARADSPVPSPAAPTPRAQRECNVTPEIERAVTKGLEYLAKTQAPDGSWGSSDGYGRVPGVVGLAVLAYLAHGDVPDEGRFGPTIRKAVDYIIKTQQPNGLLDAGSSPMYSHGFATLALAEAYGVIDEPRLGPALKKATGLIVSAQNRQGGWRYSVGSTDSDTTVSGAQMMALRAAANAGIEVPVETIKRGVAYFKSCYCSGGGFGYMGADGANLARSGIGMLVLCLSGEYRSAEVKGTADWITGHAGLGDDSYGAYGLYYCSQAMFQAGGSYWRQWNNTITPALIAKQHPDGSWTGGAGGTACETAMSLLSIEINYNLLPIYQR